MRIIPHASNCPDVNEESPTKKQKIISDQKTTQCLDCLRRAFETQNSSQLLCVALAEEKSKDRSKSSAAWEATCKTIFSIRLAQKAQNIGDKGVGLAGDQITESSPRLFYEARLKKYLGELYLATIKVMWEMGIFTVYEPDEKPFVLFSKQVDFPADINPKIDAYIPLQDLIDNSLIFADIKTFNPLASLIGFEQAKPIAYGLFYSFYPGFNCATAFFRNFRGEWGYRWAIYDRFKVGEVGSIRKSK
uniref:Uncharacterized protein n=1 Tax=viral metagenome TaxID=1070528 RepID=A0A6C0CH21_9ZZZZ